VLQKPLVRVLRIVGLAKPRLSVVLRCCASGEEARPRCCALPPLGSQICRTLERKSALAVASCLIGPIVQPRVGYPQFGSTRGTGRLPHSALGGIGKPVKPASHFEAAFPQRRGCNALGGSAGLRGPAPKVSARLK
jgi:hypothetical protein